MANSWDEYKVHILAELEQLREMSESRRKDMEEVRACLGDVRADIKALRERGTWETRILSAFWGLIMAGLTFFLNRHSS